MSNLTKFLYNRIEMTGPLKVSEYMSDCLCHPKYGYYMSRDPFGQAGDFTTAPEISQAFGELIGLWAVLVWQQMGSPEKLQLVELGPGRGTLMSDALRATQKVAGFHQALNVHLVEISPVLKEKQKTSLSSFDVPVSWHENFSDVPEGPAIFIANEFFDALPIRQFEKGEKGWGERFVDIDPEQEGQFRFVLQHDEAALALMPEILKTQEQPIGARFEISPVSQTIAYVLGERIAKEGGAVLAIDYGYSEPAFGETFQALKDHKFVEVLVNPGEADLTAHVDFKTLAQGFRDGGAAVYPLMGQGEFLERLGITERMQALLENAREDQRESLIAAHRRLCSPDEMGALFKVLCATSPNQSTPVPF